MRTSISFKCFVCCTEESNLNHWPVSALDDESEGGKRMIELGWDAQTYLSAPNLKVLKDLPGYCFQTHRDIRPVLV